MTERLVQLAASIDQAPTLEQVDAMLLELSTTDRSDAVAQRVENGLLDMRSLLTNLARAEAQGQAVALPAPAAQISERDNTPDRLDTPRSHA